jgi:hypothetical protein
MTERNEDGPGIVPATLKATRRSGMLALLLLLVAMVFVVPVLSLDAGVELVAIDIMMTLILTIGILAVADHRGIAVLLVALTIVALGVRWAASLVPSPMLPLMREGATLISLLTLAIAIGISVFGRGRAAADRLIGAVVLYLLIGIVWAVAYAILDGLSPEAFTGGRGAGFAMQHWVYFSFVTLTTVGYGDIVPAARAAQSMAMLEALVGQLYPAVILARLVSLPRESP